MDPVRFSPGRAPYRSRVLPAQRQGAVPVLVQQGEGSHLAGRSHLGRRRENRAQGHTDLQPRGEGKGNQARAHLYERVREESEREIQVKARMRRHPRASGDPAIFATKTGFPLSRERRSLPMTPVLALERVSCTFLSRDDPSERYTAVD